MILIKSVKHENNLTPQNELEIIEALALAKSRNCSVHCYSAGFNWGYGTSSSIDKDSMNLDLSAMNKIISFDEKLGILKIQPGVTQNQLLEFLKLHRFDYYVPNTGAGKRGSILGNALERGFGISPLHDHASSILSVRGILGDGSIYESALKEIDSKLADCFPWGIGPQLDKMVSQSSWIIITEVSIQLMKRHECTDILLYQFSNDHFKEIINGLTEILSTENGSVGSIKIFNKRQILEQDIESFHKLFFANKEWFMTIIVYSHPVTRASLLKLIKLKMSKYTKVKSFTLNSLKIKNLMKLLFLFPPKMRKQSTEKLKDLVEMLNLAKGETSEAGFKALDKNFNYTTTKLFDIQNFNKELTWLSPICPLDQTRVLDLLSIINKLNTHPYFKFNTFTWTILNQRTIALVIPILFEKSKEVQFWKWYKDIHRELKNEGFVPYRFHVNMMEMVREELAPNYFKHVKKFENAMNPNSIILRGRY